MNSLPYLQTYGAIALAMLVLDMLWLGLIARPWYRQGMGHLMSAEPNVVVGALFYLVFPLGLLWFAVLPTGVQQGWTHAGLTGALFGFFAYATYDLTNLATLRNWPVSLSVINVLWGTVASGLAAASGKAVQMHVGHV